MLNHFRAAMGITLLGLMIAGLSSADTPVSKNLPNPITALAWSPDGDRIAVAGGPSACSKNLDEFTIQILDAESQQPVKSLVGNTCPIYAVDWSPDGERLVSASIDTMGTRFWDVDSETLLETESIRGQGVVSVKWNPKKDNVVAASSVSTSMWTMDATTGKGLSSLPVNGVFMDWNPDGTQLIVGRGDFDPVVAVVDMTAGTWLALEGQTDIAGSVDWSPDGSTLASAGPDGIRLWDADDGTLLRVLTGHTEWIIGVVFSPDSRMIASASYDKTVRVWDVATGHAIEIIHTKDRINALDWSPDGSRLAYGGENGMFEIVPAPSPIFRRINLPAA